MGRKKKEEPKSQPEKKKPVKWYTGMKEQDTFTMCFLWYGRKDLCAQCKEAIRKIKNEPDLIQALIKIATDGTSDKATIYKDIIRMYQKETDWKTIIHKMRERMVVGE